MSLFNLASFVIFIYLLLQPSTIECRPRTQRIIVHGHEWTVPNEPGWEEVLLKAEPIRHQLLSNCPTSRDCRLAAEKLRHVFLNHPVSAKYYDDSIAASDYPESDITSIFKWG